MGSDVKLDDNQLSKSDIWRKDNSCMLCGDVCETPALQDSHCLKAKHIRKMRLYEFYTTEITKFPHGNESLLFKRYTLRKMRVLGLECVHEITTLFNPSAIWACSICFVAGGHYDAADAHLMSLNHIKTYIDEFHPDEMKNAVYDKENLCQQYEQFLRLADRIFAQNGGLQKPEIIKMNISEADAKKKFVLTDIGDTMTSHVCPKDAKKVILHCKTCNELVPTHKSTKYTVEKAKAAHLDGTVHQKCAAISGCVEEFEIEEVFDSDTRETAGDSLKWIIREDHGDLTYLNSPCGLRNCIKTGEETFCSLCFCFVENVEDHFSSENHVMNFLNGRFPFDNYLIRQLPREERQKRALQLLAKTFLENESTRKAPLQRFPLNIQSLITPDFRVFEDVQPQITEEYGQICILCPICLNMSSVPKTDDPDEEKNLKAHWLKHLTEPQHYECATRRASFVFDERFFVPHPPSIKQMAYADKGKWITVKDTDMLIQTQCDVGLEYLVEDEDNDEVVCTICARIYPRNNADVINYHIRSIQHLKQYLAITNRTMVGLILSQKVDVVAEGLLLEWLQRTSSQFAIKMKVYSKKKTIQLDDWKSVNMRTVDSSLNSLNETRDSYDALVDLVDRVANDGAELSMLGAREALIAANIRIIHTYGDDKKMTGVMCRCMNCELAFSADVETWDEDVFIRHMRNDQHYNRMKVLHENRFDSYGISEDKSNYTVKAFVQKDPAKKVSWQWNATAKVHEYVLSVVGLEEIVERRSRERENLTPDFFCALCAATFPKRAANLESHVRSFTHAMNFLHKYRAVSIRDIEDLNKKFDDRGKEVRKYMSTLLKDIAPAQMYCIRVYDPLGEAEKKSIVAQQRAKDEERAAEQQKLRLRAAEERQQRMEQQKLHREREVERIKKQTQERERREADARKRQKLVEAERNKRLEIALANAQKENESKGMIKQEIEREQEKAQFMKAHLERKRLEMEKQELQNRMNMVGQPRLVIPGNVAPKTVPMSIPQQYQQQQQFQQQQQQQIAPPQQPQQLPTQWIGMNPPPMMQGMPPGPVPMFNQPPPNFNPMQIPQKLVQPELPGIVKRPSLKGKTADPNLMDINKITSRLDLINYILKQGAERIPLAEMPVSYTSELNDTPGALGTDQIFEVICLDDPTLDSYFCTLCAEWNSPKEMAKHVVNDGHRLAYLYKNYTVYHKTVMAEKDKAIRKLVLNNFCKEIQKREQPPPKIEHRVLTILSKATIVRLWPGYETYFFENSSFTQSGFKEVNYEPVPLPAPVPKTVINLDDDVEIVEDKNEKDNKKESRSSHHKDRRRRSRSRDRRRSRSKSRERYRRRSRTRSRSRSRSRERTSRKRENSDANKWATDTDAFLARLADKKASRPKSPQGTDLKSRFENLKNFAGSIEKQDDIEESRRAAELRKQQEQQKDTTNRMRSAAPSLEDEKTKQRKMLGVIITMQQQSEITGRSIDRREIEALYSEMGLNIKEGDKLLTQMLNDMKGTSMSTAASINLASFGIATGGSVQQPQQQQTMYTQPPPIQQQYGAYAQQMQTQQTYQAPSSSSSTYQQSAGRLANLQRLVTGTMNNGGSGSSSLNLPTVQHSSFFEKNAEEIYKDAVSCVYPTGDDDNEPASKKSKQNDTASDDDSEDEEYLEIMSVLGKKPEDKKRKSDESGGSTPSQKQTEVKEQDIKRKGGDVAVKKDAPGTLPGQRMALARTVLPNGQRISTDEKPNETTGNGTTNNAGLPRISQPPIPGVTGDTLGASSLNLPGIAAPISSHRVVQQQPMQMQQQQQQQQPMMQMQQAPQQMYMQPPQQQYMYAQPQMQPQYGIQQGYQMAPQMQQQMYQPMQQQPQQMMYQQQPLGPPQQMMQPQYQMQQPQQMYMQPQQQQQMMQQAPQQQQQQPPQQYGIGGNQQQFPYY